MTKPGVRPALLVFKQFLITNNCTMHNSFQSFLFWKALESNIYLQLNIINIIVHAKRAESKPGKRLFFQSYGKAISK